MRILLLFVLVFLLMGCKPAEGGVETIPINWLPWIRAVVIWSIPLLILAYVERWGWEVPDGDWELTALILWPIAWPFVTIGILLTRIVIPLTDSGISRLTRAKFHEDEFGILYRQRTPHRDGHAMILAVTDNTGKHEIRVAPYIRTAKEAAAWTFSMKESDYNPAMET